MPYFFRKYFLTVVIGAKCKIAGFAVLSGFGSCCLKQYKLSNS